jgi:hypothetical protein
MTRTSLDDFRLQCERLISEARTLLAGIPTNQAICQPDPGAWSIAQHLEHLGIVNEQFVEALRTAIDGPRVTARNTGDLRPNLLGRWFLKMLEPPPKPRVKAPRGAQPAATVRPLEAGDRFARSVESVIQLIEAAQRVDVNRISFRHPFLPNVRFNVAAGLLMTAAHARRHLWVAARLRSQLSDRMPAIGGVRVGHCSGAVSAGDAR